jgi:hypothetical protein
MTMYQDKMVCCLKANGKILREFKDTVYVPFGSEYSILIKNLNSLRAIVNITIDGTDAVPGGLVVNANQEIDLERFVKDMSNGNKFKFIERGIKTEDGLIRVSFKYAKPTPVQQLSWGQPQWGQYPPGVRGFTHDTMTYGGAGGSMSSAIATGASSISLNNISAQSSVLRSNDVGITVPGSHSSQKFVTVQDFATEAEEHVIVLKILGETDAGQVAAPVTVKAKPKCTICNKINKATSKFCSNCGASLEIWG